VYLEVVMKREIVELDDLLLIEAEHVAKQNNKTLSEAIGVALRAWVDANRKRTLPSIVGIVNVPMSWTQEEIDQELIDGLDPYEGWSPNRSALRDREVDPEAHRNVPEA
jgi:metal-responsive CopG/Arc/MetJ family transcriptional regulator